MPQALLGITPLINAAIFGYDKSMTLLIQSGADVNMVSVHNTTALSAAAEKIISPSRKLS